MRKKRIRKRREQRNYPIGYFAQPVRLSIPVSFSCESSILVVVFVIARRGKRRVPHYCHASLTITGNESCVAHPRYLESTRELWNARPGLTQRSHSPSQSATMAAFQLDDWLWRACRCRGRPRPGHPCICTVRDAGVSLCLREQSDGERGDRDGVGPVLTDTGQVCRRVPMRSLSPRYPPIMFSNAHTPTPHDPCRAP